ncbi:1910_t:CDS:1, partial [Dentiscutata erythropus]
GRRKPCYNRRDSVKCMSESITVAKKKKSVELLHLDKPDHATRSITKEKHTITIAKKKRVSNYYMPDCATDLFAKTIPLLAKK